MEKVEASVSSQSVIIPKWCFQNLASPNAQNLQKAGAIQKAIEDIYHDTLEKHKILEQYAGVRATGPCNLIKALATKLVHVIRDTGGESIKLLADGINLVEDNSDFHFYRSDHTVRMACESTVLNALWRYVRPNDFIDSPYALLERWNNFEKERSHWWRARKAVETEETISAKWDALVEDSIHLANFHNALQHAKGLLEPKPTLKHTLHLVALTVEGRVYENGQGRSIASECRHIMVRKECDIPIKARSDKAAENAASAGNKKTKPKTKAQAAAARKQSKAISQSLSESPLKQVKRSSDSSSSSSVSSSAHKRQRLELQVPSPSSSAPMTLSAATHPYNSASSSSGGGAAHAPPLLDDALKLLMFKNNASPGAKATTAAMGMVDSSMFLKTPRGVPDLGLNLLAAGGGLDGNGDMSWRASTKRAPEAFPAPAPAPEPKPEPVTVMPSPGRGKELPKHPYENKPQPELLRANSGNWPSELGESGTTVPVVIGNNPFEQREQEQELGRGKGKFFLDDGGKEKGASAASSVEVGVGVEVEAADVAAAPPPLLRASSAEWPSVLGMGSAAVPNLTSHAVAGVFTTVTTADDGTAGTENDDA